MPKLYTLLSAVGEPYKSASPGELGGNSRLKIYGRLDCPSANRYLDRGYAAKRVFFANAEDAKAAGYRPCGICLRDDYRQWKKEVQSPPASSTSKLEPEQDDMLGEDHPFDLYKRALDTIRPLSDRERKLLLVWIEDGEHWASPSALASAMGYAEVARVNIDVGTLGSRLIKALGIDEATYRADGAGRSRFWAFYCDLYRRGKGWHLADGFVEAVKRFI